MNIDKIKGKIEQRINLLCNEFEKYPAKFLTEEDMRCYLYHLLLADYNKVEKCKDGSLSNALHCEVRWYGNNDLRKLNLRSDIAVIDTSTLRTQQFRLSKGFEFSRALAVIEIKLRRKKSRTDDARFRHSIQKDRDKFTQIREATGFKFDSYLIVFDKRNNLGLVPENDIHHKEYYIYITS